MIKEEQEKEIQKIAKILYNHQCGDDKCGECLMPNCVNYKKAKQLYKAGCRMLLSKILLKEKSPEGFEALSKIPHKEKSPEDEIEALKKLKQSLFLDYWTFGKRRYNQKAFIRIVRHLDYAGYLDEAERFCELFDEHFGSVEEMEQFLKDYFDV